MAIYKNGKKIKPFISGRQVKSIYRGGNKIYQDIIPVGTVLSTFNNTVGANGTITLSKSIESCPNGILLISSKYYEGRGKWWAYNNNGYQNFLIPKSIGYNNWFDMQVDDNQVVVAAYGISVKFVNSTTIQFNSFGTDFSHGYWQGYYLNVDSIQAY